MRRFPLALLAVVIFALVMSACSSPPAASPTAAPKPAAAPTAAAPAPTAAAKPAAATPAAAAQSAAKTLTVGALGPASGGAAPWGIALNQGGMLFTEDLQAKGGIKVGDTTYNLKQVFYDTKGDVGETATAANRLISQDQVKYIFGNAIGATCEAAQAVTEQAKVMFTFICWGRTNLGPKKPFSFRVLMGPDEVAPMMYGWLTKKLPDMKNVALISPNDQSGVDTSKGIVDATKSLGINIVANEGYERGTQEYTSLLTRVLSKKPDLIDLSGSPTGDGALILKQLKGMNYTGKLAWTSMLDPIPVVKTAGNDAAEGVYGIQGWDLKAPQSVPSLRDFAGRYEARFKEPATMVSAVQYATYQVATQAMAAAGSTDPAVVSDQIAKMGVFKDTVLGQVTIGGEVTYGLKRQFLFPLVISQIKAGTSTAIELVNP